MKHLTLLFDLDGTLTDSGPVIKRCAKLVLSHYGIDRKEDDLDVFVGPPLFDSFHDFGIEKNELDNAVSLFRKEYQEKGIYENKLYPDIENILKTLKKEEYSLYIVTSKADKMAKDVLNNFNIYQYFDGIYAPSIKKSIDETKSQLITRCINENKKENTKFVMIGDTKFDIGGAKDNNILSIACMWGYGTRDSILESKPDYMVDNPLELLYLIQSLESDC